MNKEIIVLAKSLKHGQFCIAGVDTATGEWVRPVSSNTSNEGAVPITDIIYPNGEEVHMLDKVMIKTTLHRPTISQPENYVYDSKEKWIKTGTSSLKDVILFRGYDEVDKVFYNVNRDVAEIELSGQASLLLLNVKNSHVLIKTFEDGNRKFQLNFEYKSIGYKYFTISDKFVLSCLANKPDGKYFDRDELSVVFSLTDKYEKTGKYYKMVAQIFY